MTTTEFPTRIVDINYRQVRMLPTDVARTWVDENFVNAGNGWVGIQGDRAYITDEPRPVRLGPAFPGQTVTPLPEALAAKADTYLIAEAEVGDDCWALSGRIAADDPDGTALRRKLTSRLATGIQNAFAKPCDTEGCERKAFNHGDVRVNGEAKHVNVCRTCTAAIRESQPAGPMSVLLMPYFAFAEYDD